MGCKGKKHDGDNCVCEVLRAVADAQDEVAGTDTDCDVSCHRSIRDLLAGAQDNELDTIPLILYCGDCAPFEGFGARTTNGTLTCISSFIFRVNSVDDDCCAKLELLTTNVNGDTPEGPCAQLDGADIEEFVRTGICITVDLDCFCAVTCLDPVATLPFTNNSGSSR